MSVSRDAESGITNDTVMVKTKIEDIHLFQSHGQKKSVGIPIKIVQKNSQNETQAAFSGTANTVIRYIRKVINRNFISGPLFETDEKKTRPEE